MFVVDGVLWKRNGCYCASCHDNDQIEYAILAAILALLDRYTIILVRYTIILVKSLYLVWNWNRVVVDKYTGTRTFNQINATQSTVVSRCYHGLAPDLHSSANMLYLLPGISIPSTVITWWRHQMGTIIALLPFVRGIHRWPVDTLTKASDAKLWRFVWSAPEQSRRWCFETPSRSLWRHCNDEAGPLYHCDMSLTKMMVYLSNSANMAARITSPTPHPPHPPPPPPPPTPHPHPPPPTPHPPPPPPPHTHTHRHTPHTHTQNTLIIS